MGGDFSKALRFEIPDVDSEPAEHDSSTFVESLDDSLCFYLRVSLNSKWWPSVITNVQESPLESELPRVQKYKNPQNLGWRVQAQQLRVSASSDLCPSYMAWLHSNTGPTSLWFLHGPAFCFVLLPSFVLPASHF